METKALRQSESTANDCDSDYTCCRRRVNGDQGNPAGSGGQGCGHQTMKAAVVTGNPGEEPTSGSGAGVGNERDSHEAVG